MYCILLCLVDIRDSKNKATTNIQFNVKLETDIFELQDPGQWVVTMMAQTYADGAISRSDPIPDTGLDTTQRDGRHQFPDWSVSDNAHLPLVEIVSLVIIKTSSCHQARTFDTDTFCLLNCQALDFSEVQNLSSFIFKGTHCFD